MSRKAVIVVEKPEEKAGLIKIRRWKEGLFLGARRSSAQIRLLIKDGKEYKYARGNAVYADDLPDGCDVIVYGKLKELTASNFAFSIRRLKSPYEMQKYGPIHIVSYLSYRGWDAGAVSQFLSKPIFDYRFDREEKH